MIQVETLRESQAINYLYFSNENGYKDGTITSSYDEISNVIFEKHQSTYYLIKYLGNKSISDIKDEFESRLLAQNIKSKRIVISISQSENMDLYNLGDISNYILDKFSYDDTVSIMRTKVDEDISDDTVGVELLFV